VRGLFAEIATKVSRDDSQEFVMYLIANKKARVSHLWNGTDTVCRLFSTGGMKKKGYEVFPETGGLPICSLCENHGKTLPCHVKAKAERQAKRLASPAKVKKTPNQSPLVAPGHCKKCGLPIKWSTLPSGKFCPVNPDGSQHFDICNQTRNAGKVYAPIASRWIRGSKYVETESDGSLPWEE
jgi:hypothetical protein